MATRRVIVVTTGGTIAIKGGGGPVVGGAVPMIKGEDILSQLPRRTINVSFSEFSNVPGSHLTPALALDLAQRVQTMLLDLDVDGVVVAHGTDTLEETAYLLDLTIGLPKPVVLTGAMRTASMVGYDGLANLAAAVRVAAAPEAAETGTLVVLGGAIHAAAEVRQVSSHAINAFQSPGSGPLGYVEGDRVWMQRRSLQRLHIPCTRLEEMVDLICLGQGSDDRLLRHAISDGVAGVVIESFGSGRVPPWWLPTIQDAVLRRIAVVVVSRCSVGSLYDDYGYVGGYHDLRRLGVLFAHHLSGLKARIKLMVALGAARSHEDLKGWFA